MWKLGKLEEAGEGKVRNHTWHNWRALCSKWSLDRRGAKHWGAGEWTNKGWVEEGKGQHHGGWHMLVHGGAAWSSDMPCRVMLDTNCYLGKGRLENPAVEDTKKQQQCTVGMCCVQCKAWTLRCAEPCGAGTRIKTNKLAKSVT